MVTNIGLGLTLSYEELLNRARSSEVISQLTRDINYLSYLIT